MNHSGYTYLKENFRELKLWQIVRKDKENVSIWKIKPVEFGYIPKLYGFLTYFTLSYDIKHRSTKLQFYFLCIVEVFHWCALLGKSNDVTLLSLFLHISKMTYHNYINILRLFQGCHFHLTGSQRQTSCNWKGLYS